MRWATPGCRRSAQIPGLTYLDLNGRQGTDANVWAISISEVGLDAVLTLKDLRELRFGCTSLGVGIEGARFATVSATDVTVRWLEKMKALPKLEKLSCKAVAGKRRRDPRAVRIAQLA